MTQRQTFTETNKFIDAFTVVHQTSNLHIHAVMNNLNTLAPGLIQAVCKKQLDHTWLCAWISLLLYGLRTCLKCQKTPAFEKLFLFWGCGLFVSDIISRRLFVHLGQLHLALGANC